MISSLKKLFEGTSGNEYKYWPPRGIPVLRGESDVYSAYEEEKLASPLSRLRKLMAQRGVGIYLIMEQDEHQSEYVADTDRRIRFISNFPGSAGFVSVGRDWAELATDSRYFIIASRKLSSEWHLRKLRTPGVKNWDDAVIERAISEGVDIGVDPKLINAEVAEKIDSQLRSAGRKLIPIEENLVDIVWGDEKPPLPPTKIVSHPLSLTGEPVESKVAHLRESMAERHAKSFVIYSLEEIAWLLNLRGGDVPYVPIFKSFVIVTKDSLTLYVDRSKLEVDLTHRHEGEKITVADYSSFFDKQVKIPKPVWIPGKGSWAVLRKAMENTKKPDTSALITDFSPINLRRAVKNPAEIAGIRDSQFKCSLSIVRYFSWLGQHIDEDLNEYEGGLKLLEIRKTLPDFRGNSFETISAAGPNASAPHYAPTPEDAAPIRRDQVYLLDSGSQFLQGSTDITRTVHYGTPSAEEIRAYTLVLKGQLAVATAVFPEKYSGFNLDILARQFLWKHSMDYGHGTGHGIGSYLNIHELPLGIGMTAGPESFLVAGHFVSDEPGYYEDGEFGVRLESDILVVPYSQGAAGRQYLTFETMTLVPYEPRLIDKTLLTPEEITTIDNYHQKCRDALRPHLTEYFEIEWLNRCTKPIA